MTGLPDSPHAVCQRLTLARLLIKCLLYHVRSLSLSTPYIKLLCISARKIIYEQFESDIFDLELVNWTMDAEFRELL